MRERNRIMKKSLYIVIFTLGAMLSSCSKDWLSTAPDGSTITDEQHAAMDNVLEGDVRGIYALLYQYGGDHDVFGVRSIDMYGDITCGDMAMPNYSYGWFQTDELGQSYTRGGYMWGLNYGIIRQCNKSINVAQKIVGKDDLMNVDLVKNNPETFWHYAEILTMRAWAYSSLMRWFCPTPEFLATNKRDYDNYKPLPLYSEEDTEKDETMGAPVSSATDCYNVIEEDLMTAIFYFSTLEKEGYTRGTKQEVNLDVARLLLAYSFLNKGEYAKAQQYAEEFIKYTTHTLLPLNELTTTGFANIGHNNWVWGQDVTVETTTSLASFFGQVDIYSYSYASAGDIKGIDENLYNSIKDNHTWDARKAWWNNMQDNGVKGFQYAPDGKFYSPTIMQKVGYKRAPGSDELDRDWLCDNVYMRTELGYMIAAEAAARNNEPGKAVTYLTNITDQRVKEGMESSYDSWKATLSGETLLSEIQYNWRVEFWGEGYGLQTFRRFGKPYTLGTNHKTRSGSTISIYDANDYVYTLLIPSSEQKYNPFMREDTDNGGNKIIRKKQ